ncbi:MAG TPA: ABC transporter permease [Bacteroidales bacterium]|nr:ABC transporter permease [Bacteroidales bacterium]
MNFPTYIATRYLFAKKSHNAINIISAISVVCITIGTMALVIVLSVFNGFDDIIRKQFNSFDPQLRITVAEGKTFPNNSPKIRQLSSISEIQAFSKTVEENVLLKYGEKQYIATIKGVDENYLKVNTVDTAIIDGEFKLKDGNTSFAVIGQGVGYFLQVGLQFVNPIVVYVLRKDAPISANPQNAVNQKYIYPSGVFGVEAETDAKYIIVPLDFAQSLLEDTVSLTAIELRLKDGVDMKHAKEKIQQALGSQFLVKDRYEQKELFYRIMKYEKWAIFFILSFILIIASFNVIGSLAVLIIEKRKDIAIMSSMGADEKLIRHVFQVEGLYISLSGAVFGVILGLIICWAQIQFGLLQLSGSGSFIIDAYPVSIRLVDILFVFFTVLAIGFIASRYTVKVIVKRYLTKNP